MDNNENMEEQAMDLDKMLKKDIIKQYEALNEALGYAKREINNKKRAIGRLKSDVTRQKEKMDRFQGETATQAQKVLILEQRMEKVTIENDKLKEKYHFIRGVVDEIIEYLKTEFPDGEGGVQNPATWNFIAWIKIGKMLFEQAKKIVIAIKG